MCHDTMGVWRVEVMERVLSVLCLWSGAGEAESSKIVTFMASWSGVRRDGCIGGGSVSSNLG
jgi:hypothetical protein